MWLEAVLADGGDDCKELCQLANEPLVEGMLVGHPENRLSVAERREVNRTSEIYEKRTDVT